MHPILAHPWRLAVYLAIWIPLGVLLAALLALQGALGWTDALLAAVPLSIAYGFLCLSAWYVTGGSPVDRLGGMRVAASFLLSALLGFVLARTTLGPAKPVAGQGAKKQQDPAPARPMSG